MVGATRPTGVSARTRADNARFANMKIDRASIRDLPALLNQTTDAEWDDGGSAPSSTSEEIVLYSASGASSAPLANGRLESANVLGGNGAGHGKTMACPTGIA